MSGNYLEDLNRSKMSFYRKAADDLFKTNLINNSEDDERLVELCKEIMDENNIPNEGQEDDDVWLEFVYRAQELLEIDQDGYCYRWVNGEYLLQPKRGELINE